MPYQMTFEVVIELGDEYGPTDEAERMAQSMVSGALLEQMGERCVDVQLTYTREVIC